MKRTFTTLALACVLATQPANAQQAAVPSWVVATGVSQTTLGDPRGFGTTGGTTIEVGLRKEILHSGAWHVGPLVRVRGWGFEHPGSRTIGIELDVGVHVGRDFARLSEGRLYVWGEGAVKGYRAPLETAIGRWRFIGLSPVGCAGLGYHKPRGFVAEVGVSIAHYDTWGWTGQSYAITARIGGWW